MILRDPIHTQRKILQGIQGAGNFGVILEFGLPTAGKNAIIKISQKADKKRV